MLAAGVGRSATSEGEGNRAEEPRTRGEGERERVGEVKGDRAGRQHLVLVALVPSLPQERWTSTHPVP